MPGLLVENSRSMFLPHEWPLSVKYNRPICLPFLYRRTYLKTIRPAVRNHHRDYWTGTVYTTNRRVWEFDDNFKDYLRRIRCMAVDMETATLFSVGFANQIPVGALLLVSDQPMISTGVKTEESDKKITRDFVEEHVLIGVEALKLIIDKRTTVKHLRFDEE